ncbi:MAG: hypothetical protein HQL37_14525, partial [Alphaproteobacteria bacterium]|nr:hypothetical protein [Alphaproteobacteria bacterium]
VFLPKSKFAVPCPGGIDAAYDWQAALDETTGNMLVVTYVNDVEAYP